MELAKDFFDIQHTKTKEIDNFFESDLHFYLKSLYGEIIFIKEEDREKHFFISVSKVQGDYYFTERIFIAHDWGDPVGYIIPKSLEHLRGKRFCWDENDFRAVSLSKHGFCTYDLSESELNFVKTLPGLPYSSKNSEYDTTRHYRFTSKYSNAENLSHPIHLQAKNLMKNALPKSTLMEELDYYNSNFLHYPKGTSIAPHNDIDVCSFVDIVLYSGLPDSKTTIIGECDWYNKVFNQLFIGELGDKDIEDENLLVRELHRHNSNEQSAIVFNFFNPKFYHEVPPTLNECYTGLVFGSFKGIMNDKEIEW